MNAFLLLSVHVRNADNSITCVSSNVICAIETSKVQNKQALLFLINFICQAYKV